MKDRNHYDAVVVGAGFAGMYMLHRLRGMGFSVRVFEAGGDVGGTWYWNRYPGARCDIESMLYSYQFSSELEQEWDWSERYATQPEILAYINHVADRFSLRTDIQFNTQVEGANYDEQTGRWHVRTRCGDEIEEASAQFLVMATGCLSSTNIPDFPGRDSFAGPMYHTGRWPHEGVDFTGQRVGVIGTGSSGVQAIPHIAKQAQQLFVFQRTATYAVPAHNRMLSAEEKNAIKADYTGFRASTGVMQAAAGNTSLAPSMITAMAVGPEERASTYEAYWNQGGLLFTSAFSDLLYSSESNETAAEFVREKIRTVVKDPVVAARLSPKTPIGCKRMCVDTGYYQTYNRPNVELVDISETPIKEITPTGLSVGDRHFELDSIVFATGFDAITGSLLRIDIRGRGGRPLREAWAEGPRTYLGLGSVGFPNLFTITGPGSPSVLTNMVVSIEEHVNWIADCMAYMRKHSFQRIEATPEAQDAWVDLGNDFASYTLYPTCNSWFLGANIPGKPRVFIPFINYFFYASKCEYVAENDYDGFALTRGPE